MTSVVRTLRTHRDLRLLLGAGLVSLSGDWILGVGLAYSIYVLTGSTLASAVTLLGNRLAELGWVRDLYVAGSLATGDYVP